MERRREGMKKGEKVEEEQVNCNRKANKEDEKKKMSNNWNEEEKVLPDISLLGNED